MQYVPERYRSTTRDEIVLWSCDGTEPVLAPLLVESRRAIERLLEYRLQRTLHAVVYATHDEARRALDREVSPDGLLAPLHTPALALIAWQSPAADPRNGDRVRMRRHLAHELGHVFTAERTGSVKSLGDGDRGMRIAPWIDEGFADVVAATVADRPDVIERALANADSRTDEQLAAAFRDLGSPDRAVASAIATARMWRTVQLQGFPRVFETLANSA